MLQELQVLQVLQEPEEPQVVKALVKLTKLFVLKLAYPVDSEVGGSERRTAARISDRQVQH